MINFQDMVDIKRYKPGEKIKCMLLYFPNVNKFKVHYDYCSSGDLFTFTDVGTDIFSDKASLWIELELNKNWNERP
jgi:hypothetical protein